MLLGIALHSALSFVAFPWIVQDSQQHEGFGLFFFAVHGFRMPVFFVMSGFFTAMLWRRRGLGSLVRQRTLRVLLPCMIGLITIVPLVDWVCGMAIESTLEEDEESPSGEEKETNIWTAAATGDIETVTRHLSKGDDVNGQDPLFGVTPLAWAALLGQTETAEYLISEGADVNIPNRDGGTPLHAAAFLGRAATANLLIRHGAAVDARNNAGETPLQSSKVDWGTTEFIAGLLKIDLDEEAVQTGRQKCAVLLRRNAPGDEEGKSGDSASNGGRGDAGEDGRQGERSRGAVREWILALTFTPVFATPVFHHLWFLWHLCWLVLAFVLYAAVMNCFKRTGAPKWLTLPALRYLWLIPLTMIPQWYMGLLLPIFGPDTSTGWLPMPHVLFYYAVFFGFGVLYYDSNDETGRVGRWWWFTLPCALLIIFPLGLEFSIGAFGFRNELIDPAAHRPIATALQVAYAWMMTFGLMGLFRRLLARENRVVRYLSDSSYWLYLAHVPLVIGAQSVVRDWTGPAILKFTLVCVAVSAFLLLLYQIAVRYTLVGRLLNGPRIRRGSKTDPAEEERVTS